MAFRGGGDPSIFPIYYKAVTTTNGSDQVQFLGYTTNTYQATFLTGEETDSENAGNPAAGERPAGAGPR